MSSLLLLLQIVAVERDARLQITDTLGETTEIHCAQRLVFSDEALRIEDLTFGTVILVRADLGKLWVWDRFLRRDFETDLADWNAAHARELDGIAEARGSVRGTEEAERLSRLLIAFGRYDAEPAVAVEPDDGMQRVVVDGRQTFARLELDADGPGHPYALLAKAGAFHAKVGEAMAGLHGTPKRGLERYVLLGRSYRVEFETTSVGTAEKGEFDPPAGYTRCTGPDLRP